MGDLNQLNFVKKYSKLISEPILEVGSKDYGNTPDFRSLFPNYEYIGVDMQKGKGVDKDLDLTLNFEIVNKQLNYKKFKTIICFSVLEHCDDPFKMAENISKLLDKGGILFVSVPFSFPIHAYPSDYWRFTSEGVKTLFKELDFNKYPGNITTYIGEVRKIYPGLLHVNPNTSKGLKLKLSKLFIDFFLLMCRRLNILPLIFDHPSLFPPLMVNMIGRKI